MNGGFFSALMHFDIDELWLERKFPRRVDRSDRINFIQAEGVLFRGSRDFLVFSNPQALQSGYDEFLIGIRSGRVNVKSPQSKWERVAKWGANQSIHEALDVRALLKQERQAHLVRCRSTLRNPRGEPQYIHLFDCGVLFSSAASEQLLIVTHRALPFVVEISGCAEAISSELAHHKLVAFQ